MTDGWQPTVDPARIREALLALEGTVIEDLRLPLPGDLRDLAKAAPLVSGVVEDRIPALLNSVRGHTWDQDDNLHAFEFRRFPIGFPDILLVERANPDNVLFQMEAKSWYILASDPLTARFETSPVIMTEGTIIAIVAWLLDGVVAGSPKLLRIHSDDAHRLAAVRDVAWEAIEPAGSHRVIHPENAPGTSRNLVQTVARGEMFRHGRWEKDSDNYGKLERLYDEQIRTFRDTVWSLTAAGKSLKEWHDFAKRSARNAGLGARVTTITERDGQAGERPAHCPDHRFRTGSTAACNDLTRTWGNAGRLRLFRPPPRLPRQSHQPYRPPQSPQAPRRLLNAP